ncbi:hypothetical protein AMECASPLE_028165 [Ameca splendens]|uniref:Uncharacterized protein n=1 Tax=Ameca splendens TaxID=208324 RepID=A0ABV0XUG5_9TELE
MPDQNQAAHLNLEIQAAPHTVGLQVPPERTVLKSFNEPSSRTSPVCSVLLADSLSSDLLQIMMLDLKPSTLCVLTLSQQDSAVEMFEGHQFILLPCEFPTFDMHDPTMVWSRSNLSPSTVHQR